jgi:hypothetical protein
VDAKIDLISTQNKAGQGKWRSANEIYLNFDLNCQD